MSRLFVQASSQRVDIAEAPVTAAPLTMACWAKPVTLATQNLFGLGYRSSTTNYFALQIIAGTPAVFRVAANDASLRVAAHATAPVAGTWQHFCGVFASSTSRKAYLNGVNPVEDTNSCSPASINGAAIGVKPGSSFVAYADAYIAHCAIWNAALSDSEVAQLAAGQPPTNVKVANLVSYVPMTLNQSPEPDSVWA